MAFLIGKKLSEEHKKNVSEGLKRAYLEGRKSKPKGMLGKVHTEETKKKLSLANKGKHEATKFKKGHLTWNKGLTKENDIKLKEIGNKISISNKGHKRSIESKIKQSLSIKRLYQNGFNPRLGKKQSKESINKRNKSMEEIRKNPEYLRKLSEKTSEFWNNSKNKEQRIKAILKGLFETRPTSYEKKIIDVINKHNLPYKYVGDGSFLIGYKNPDFINYNGEKIAIEVYNKFHHPEDYEQKRSEHFAKYGWKTIFVNEDEVLSNDENIILNKINRGDDLLHF